MNTAMKKGILASSIALSLAAPTANAALITNLFGPYTWSTDRANFTMLSPAGHIVGGTNDVSMYWDGNGYNSVLTTPARAAPRT